MAAGPTLCDIPLHGAFHADRSTTDAIRDVLVRFYTPDEINSAKNELNDECFDVLGVAPVHRDTAARGAHVIAAKEIVDGIRKVDAAEVKVRPQFAAIATVWPGGARHNVVGGATPGSRATLQSTRRSDGSV